jgi:hypothetical protein
VVRVVKKLDEAVDDEIAADAVIEEVEVVMDSRA